MREVIVSFHIIVDHVWRHDGANISEFAIFLGGWVILAKGKSARWRIWP
jgi:hypothetical protein